MDKKPAGAKDHLANERTFLAWIRTSFALMGFGFVIVEFALFVRQLSLVLHTPGANPGRGYEEGIGIGMVVLGAVMSLLAYLRYRHIEKQLLRQEYFASWWLSVLVTLALVIGSILLLWYLLAGV